MKSDVIHTRHVLAVKDLETAKDYFCDKLGFNRDFAVPGWEFLSFGSFKVMLGECTDAMRAAETGDHSYFAHVLVTDIDAIYNDFYQRGAEFIFHPRNQPWKLREFGIVTPDGHRIVFGQELEQREANS